MRDIIFDAISCCFWNCNTGKINVYDKSWLKVIKKEKMLKRQIFLT